MSKKNENLLDVSFEEISIRLNNGLKIACYNIAVAEMIHCVMDRIYNIDCLAYCDDENKFIIEKLF